MPEEQQKAARVTPPMPEPDIIEVDMTNVYATLGLLSVSTAALAATTVTLWRRVRKNAEDVETLREYTSRLVRDTECGELAYRNIVAAAEAEERAEAEAESMANFDDFETYPEYETPEPRVRARGVPNPLDE